MFVGLSAPLAACKQKKLNNCILFSVKKIQPTGSLLKTKLDQRGAELMFNHVNNYFSNSTHGLTNQS
jgi:hypothetical protein